MTATARHTCGRTCVLLLESYCARPELLVMCPTNQGKQDATCTVTVDVESPPESQPRIEVGQFGPQPCDGGSMDGEQTLSEAFRDVTAGMCTPGSIVTAMYDDRPHGRTVSAFASLSLQPPMMMLAALDRESDLLALARRNKRFGVIALGTVFDAERSPADPLTYDFRKIGPHAVLELQPR